MSRMPCTRCGRGRARSRCIMKTSATSGSSRARIWDDGRDMVLILEPGLHAEGVRVLKATTGESALRLARQEHPPLILLDMYLPRIDGLAVCRILRAELGPHLRNVPIVMLTGV